MRGTRVIVALETSEILEVEEICLDQDAAAALAFVKRHVKPQIDAARKSGCDAQLGLRGPERPPDGNGGRT